MLLLGSGCEEGRYDCRRTLILVFRRALGLSLYFKPSSHRADLGLQAKTPSKQQNSPYFLSAERYRDAAGHGKAFASTS
jgi:hypothetical protein